MNRSLEVLCKTVNVLNVTKEHLSHWNLSYKSNFDIITFTQNMVWHKSTNSFSITDLVIQYFVAVNTVNRKTLLLSICNLCFTWFSWKSRSIFVFVISKVKSAELEWFFVNYYNFFELSVTYNFLRDARCGVLLYQIWPLVFLLLLTEKATNLIEFWGIFERYEVD